MAIPPRELPVSKDQQPRTSRALNYTDIEIPSNLMRTYFSGGQWLIKDGRIVPGADLTKLPPEVLKHVRSALRTQKGSFSGVPKSVEQPNVRGGWRRQPRVALPPVQLPAKPEKFSINREASAHIPKSGEVQTLYYARPAWMIGTAADKQNLAMLKKRYPLARILMAKPGEHKDRMKDDPFEIHAKVKMKKFHNRVGKADMVVAVEAEQGSLSSGVYSEVRKAQKNGIQTRVLRGNNLRQVASTQVIPDADKRSQASTWARVKLR